MKYRIMITLLAIALLLSPGLAQEGNQTENLNDSVEENVTGMVEESNVTEIAGEVPEGEVEDIPEEPEEKCGNGIIDQGENCASCPADVRCQSGERCDLQTGQCVKESDLTLYIVIGFLVVAIIAFFALKVIRKKKTEPEKKPIAQQNQQQPMQQQGQIAKQAEAQKQANMEPAEKKAQQETAQKQPEQAQPTSQQPEAKPQEPTKTEATETPKVQQPEAKEQGPPKTEMKGAETQKAQQPKQDAKKDPSSEKIQSYIRQMRSKGHDDESIRKKLRKQGWKDSKIAIEFLTMDRNK